MPEDQAPRSLEALLARAACEDLIAQYTHLVDGGEAAKAAGLFTDDGVFVSRNLNMRGREELIKGYENRQRQPYHSRHVMTNLRITLTGPDTAESTAYLTLYRDVNGLTPIGVAEAQDRFRRTPDGWRFAERRLIPQISPVQAREGNE